MLRHKNTTLVFTVSFANVFQGLFVSVPSSAPVSKKGILFRDDTVPLIHVSFQMPHFRIVMTDTR